MLILAQTNFLTLVIALPMLAQKTSASDEQLIRKLLSDFATARNALDAKALASMFTETGHYTTTGQFLVSGRLEIQKLWAFTFSSVPLGRATRTIHSVRFMRPDIAVADVDVIPSGFGTNSKLMDIYVLSKSGAGEWKIAEAWTVASPYSAP